jgi:hypothetical protein
MDNVKPSREDNFKMHLKEIVIIKMYTGSEEVQRTMGMLASVMQRTSSLGQPPSVFTQPITLMQILLIL